jgi:hypothetical protein
MSASQNGYLEPVLHADPDHPGCAVVFMESIGKLASIGRGIARNKHPVRSPVYFE